MSDTLTITGLKFISEVSGLTKLQLSPDLLKVGDQLKWQKESTNSFDQYAVKIFKDNTEIGYVKKIHSQVFLKMGQKV